MGFCGAQPSRRRVGVQGSARRRRGGARLALQIEFRHGGAHCCTRRQTGLPIPGPHRCSQMLPRGMTAGTLMS